MNAAFAQYRRQRKANVFDAFDVIMVGRDVENRIFIVGNGAANAGKKIPQTKVCGILGIVSI